MDDRNPSELLAAWLDGELDRKGTIQLLEHFRAQPASLEEAARLKSVDRLLRVTVIDAGADAFVREVAVRCGAGDPAGAFIPHLHWRIRWKRWASLAAAASLIIGAGAIFWKNSQPIALVARLEGAQWKEGERGLRQGDRLARGRFELTHGFAALRFDRGAQLLIEGPAELELISSARVRLHSGNAFAHVPKQAIGFSVEGPTGRVIDRGTDFGVHVGSGRMEVHVLKGLVEAGRGSSLQPLRENEALQMSAKTVSAIPADVGRFVTNLPPQTVKPIGWAHWAFDEDAGDVTRSNGAGSEGAGQDARLLSLENASRGPQWTTGQFGSALSFDGEDDYVQTDYSGIGGGAARTVAFWVKVPRNFQPKNGYAMVCWGSTQELTSGWQISVNPKGDQGAIGSLRVARIGGPIIGTTDLRDDRWHHVAVVFYGSDQPAVATQVLIYIDGSLERTVRKGILNVRTDTAGLRTRKVAFGLNIGPTSPDPSRPPAWRVFRGCLDEIFICDAALTQAQVRDLMLRNHTGAFAPEAQH